MKMWIQGCGTSLVVCLLIQATTTVISTKATTTLAKSTRAAAVTVNSATAATTTVISTKPTTAPAQSTKAAVVTVNSATAGDHSTPGTATLPTNANITADKCNAVSHPNAIANRNGVVDNGTTVTYTCSSGYITRVGKTKYVLVCIGHDIWNNKVNQCEKITTPNPASSSAAPAKASNSLTTILVACGCVVFVVICVIVGTCVVMQKKRKQQGPKGLTKQQPVNLDSQPANPSIQAAGLTVATTVGALSNEFPTTHTVSSAISTEASSASTADESVV